MLKDSHRSSTGSHLSEFARLANKQRRYTLMRENLLLYSLLLSEDIEEDTEDVQREYSLDNRVAAGSEKALIDERNQEPLVKVVSDAQTRVDGALLADYLPHFPHLLEESVHR